MARVVSSLMACFFLAGCSKPHSEPCYVEALDCYTEEVVELQNMEKELGQRFAAHYEKAARIQAEHRKVQEAKAASMCGHGHGHDMDDEIAEDMRLESEELKALLNSLYEDTKSIQANIFAQKERVREARDFQIP